MCGHEKMHHLRLLKSCVFGYFLFHKLAKNRAPLTTFRDFFAVNSRVNQFFEVPAPHLNLDSVNQHTYAHFFFFLPVLVKVPYFIYSTFQDNISFPCRVMNIWKIAPRISLEEKQETNTLLGQGLANPDTILGATGYWDEKKADSIFVFCDQRATRSS